MDWERDGVNEERFLVGVFDCSRRVSTQLAAGILQAGLRDDPFPAEPSVLAQMTGMKNVILPTPWLIM